ncbi:bifunctional tRNA (5-methylaminomethyl-2-thiouridine)(34)-methyltransferase MnmD/FAD-dependent 5-carboxymethylaminomethyl-2-thiouridine(34) oxidoreductase MnmC [Pseudomonas sp. MAP12]|uniref:tRNA 5-methylaminomethyl-2-thiouridine biosynthesis bifunctional protein MnmC n=1 Tax=Geopseudomonas aromaticivorans TaxID=2849492 RepID=A0ABS6MRQ7_9GAMM|nr:bifunctional tRNA (5-methylaminomethyl-2-thiouridine)(34)-methyltransferase MnmD/FAD-dependent 5-carboxymethylaminomethyl-2-thiouridine(34) oxidoreductase MnmC [Pseudomonas aromaticivorans]MBV2131483.1 bifunctional tRNA (5-methylaminomethyl-2-thiouridine)(34)-methyltransferase MnmD/FAD-dependent 5-carboxymethylaminomethyl-2-thiouridine(34) oxidoreductase MnmC [Pseudomonas aromaticivorans]
MTEQAHAQIDWDEQGQPLSRTFGDVYFSRTSGVEECRYVFLAHNHLAERFAALPADGRLVIGETGFGTGLNFLCAWQLFEQTAPDTAHLHFVSAEKYPLTRRDLERALALWPELAPQAGQLLAHYVAVHEGFQRFVFAGGRVVLTLLVGDVLDTLPQLDARIEAWFLDGFSPAKNPQMWTPELFAQLARLSAPGATLATFASTGFVRRGLIEAGFAMARVKGFEHKWEMLAGAFLGAPPAGGKPWYARPPRPSGPRAALVIGGGLAGCATASSLAERGWQVTLIERHAELAMEASGNPQGVLYLKLSAHRTALSKLVVSGFGHTRRQLERLQAGSDWSACGVLQLAFDAKEAERQARLAGAFPADLLRAVDASEASQLAGLPLEHGGLWYAEAGWVHPPALCRQLASHPNIRVLRSAEALDLQRVDGQWQACQGNRLLAAAPVAVLCTASEVRQFAVTAHLKLKRIRGQITRLPATAASRRVQTVLCAEGYVAPPRGNEHTLGASFNFQREDLDLCPDEHADNLGMLRQISPALGEALDIEHLDPTQLQGRAAFRSTSPDYLPLIGPVVDAQAFNAAYAGLAKDASRRIDTPAPWLEGLYVNCGHGSRGLITAPLSGELLAAWLDDEALPLPRAVAEACHPSRFLLRELIRGR